jgi:uncharacterized membrane protein (UPF0182 family)
MPRERRRRSRRSNPRRFRIIAAVAVVLIIILFGSVRGLAGFYTDYLWFKSLHQSGVWSGVLGAKVALAAIFTTIFFLLLWTNLYVADRLAPTFRMGGHEDELVVRFQEIVGPRMGLVRFVLSAVFAVIAGIGVSSQWNNWILFTHRVDFATRDATFHTNVGFYVFQLPFLSFVLGWLFASLAVILVVTAVAHYFNGGIQVQGPGPLSSRVSPGVKAHLSVLLGVLALVKTGQYWLQRYQLVFSTRGTVNGATYTDVNVQLKAIYLLVLISLFAFALFIVNIWRRGWVLPVLAVGLWAFVAIVAGVAVPAFVQRVRVQPAESSMERPYIKHNIDATRQAYGLQNIAVQSFPDDGKLDATALRDNSQTVQNVRLWDPSTMNSIFTRLQGIRSFYNIPDVDVDRYSLNGSSNNTQVLLSARTLDPTKLPQSSWEATHLAYTHGYGSIMAPANAASNGQPAFINRDIPVQTLAGAPKVTQPEVYIGEGQGGYAIVKTKRQEIDYTDKSNQTKYTTYTGKDGVTIGSGIGGFLRKAAFWLRFGDINPLISSNITPESKVIYERDVKTRVQKLAPFLKLDADPYTIIGANGHLQYIVDAYTTTGNYPNSQGADTSDEPDGSGLAGSFNYVRNSVKAVVDTYDGTVTFYIVDQGDPIIRAYAKAFPHLFTTKIPAELRKHFRYPEDLFRVQTNMYGRYHLTNPDDFYTKADAWQVSADPNQAAGNTVVDRNGVIVPRGHTMDPYYLLMRLPQDQQESFLTLRPFVPEQGNDATKQVLTAFMTAQSDPSNYGKLRLFTLPGNNLPSGPYNIVANMMQDSNVSRLQSLLCNNKSGGDGTTGGSECDFGNTLLIPIDNSLLYVRPWYVKASGNALPELDEVIVGYQNANGNTRVAVETSFRAALVDLFGPNVPLTLEANPKAQITTQTGQSLGSGGSGSTSTTSPGSSTTSSTTLPPTGSSQRDLIAQINAAFDKADSDLKAGDLAAYAADVAKAQTLARQLQAKLNSTTSTTVAK